MAGLATTKVVTSKVRFSYAHVFEPTSIEEGGTKKFNISVIIPKSDKALLKKIEKAIQLAKTEGTAKFGGKIPAKLKTPLRDGDEERPDDEAYENAMFFNASSTRRPQIVDESRNEILDQDEFYSGCYGRISVNFYAFNSNGNKGIAAGLGNLQKLEDGERFSGGSTADEDFGDEGEDLL